MEYYGKCKYDIKNDCSSPRNHKMMMTRAGKFMIHSVLYASLILLTIPWTQKMPLSKKKKKVLFRETQEESFLSSDNYRLDKYYMVLLHIM